jgi:hypothetical protein
MQIYTSFIVSFTTKSIGMMMKVQQRIKEIRSKIMPSSAEVVREAFERLKLTKWSPLNPKGKKPEEIVNRFNDYLRAVFEKTLEVLEEYEERIYSESAFKEICIFYSKELEQIAQSMGSKFTPADFTYKALQRLYPDLWRIFLSRSQSRKTRGGMDFEYQIRYLLELADIPFEPQPRKYRVDLLIPNSQAFKRDKTRTLIFSIKRTLRERWREVVEELYNTRCPNVFLLTTDPVEKISKEKVKDLTRYNIHLVVWDEIKANEKFLNEPMVLGYTDLMNREIPTFKTFWKK